MRSFNKKKSFVDSSGLDKGSRHRGLWGFHYSFPEPQNPRASDSKFYLYSSIFSLFDSIVEKMKKKQSPFILKLKNFERSFYDSADKGAVEGKI